MLLKEDIYYCAARALTTLFVCTFQLDTERAKYLLEQAFEEDANDNREEAFELYAQAAEFFLKLVDDLILLLLWSYLLTFVRNICKYFLLSYNFYGIVEQHYYHCRETKRQTEINGVRSKNWPLKP